MTRLPNVATPLTAFTVTVFPPPANVPPLRVRVTAEVLPVTVLPNESCTATVTAGVIGTVAVLGVGCWTNPRFAAAAGLIVNAANPGPRFGLSLVARRPLLPATLIVPLANEGIPLTAV